MPYQALALKWRPQYLTDLVGQAHVVRALTHALEQQRIHHAYLFTGTRGIGKTSLARILAQCLNCEEGITPHPCGTCSACVAIRAGNFPDLLEIDAASRTKVEETRELLANVCYAPTHGRFKIYLIDEVHMLSTHSFNALLKTLEEPPAHVKFFLATTDPQRLPMTVLSRCLQFHLHHLTSAQMLPHLRHILEDEHIPYETTALELLCQASQGSLRDALSLLDQAIAHCAGKIQLTDVQAMLGRVGQQVVDDLLLAIVTRDKQGAYAHIQQIAQHHADFNQILEDMLTTLHAAAVMQQMPTDAPMQPQALPVLVEQCKPEDLQLLYQIGLLGRRDLPYAPSQQIGFTMTVLRMLAFTPVSHAGLEPTFAPEKSQPTQPTKPAATIQKSETTTWNDILPHLQLKGGTYTVASHCSIKRWENTLLELTLDTGAAPMLTPQQEKNIQTAVKNHLGDTIKVRIEVGTPTTETPATKAQAVYTAKQQAAEQAMQNDDNVQAILTEFDGIMAATEPLTKEEN